MCQVAATYVRFSRIDLGDPRLDFHLYLLELLQLQHRIGVVWQNAGKE
jgi:hypothetical protein